MYIYKLCVQSESILLRVRFSVGTSGESTLVHCYETSLRLGLREETRGKFGKAKVPCLFNCGGLYKTLKMSPILLNVSQVGLNQWPLAV